MGQLAEEIKKSVPIRPILVSDKEQDMLVDHMTKCQCKWCIKPYKIHVKSIFGDSLTISNAWGYNIVFDLKRRIGKDLGVSPMKLRLVLGSQELLDNFKELHDIKVVGNCTVQAFFNIEDSKRDTTRA